MASDEHFKSIQNSVTKCLVETTRTARLIAGEDLAFHRASNPALAKRVDGQKLRMLNIVQKLLTNAAAGSDLPVPKLSDAESLDDNWQGIVDIVDCLLEKVDSCLDEHTGVIKRPDPAQKDAVVPLVPRWKPKFGDRFRGQDLAKPQLLFIKLPNNDETFPFKPILRSKPHAIVPLQECMNSDLSEYTIKQYDTRFSPLLPKNYFVELTRSLMIVHCSYEHPYETEILNAQYPQTIFQKIDPVPYLPFESTSATFVDTLEAVGIMLSELQSAKEIAVDLEHHETHSYVGLVSLMQISTRDKDWIVDTLKPWREDLQLLNEVFADPRILKVFHGSTMDMIWLQRDLGLYVVNLFDTYHASKFLGYEKHSLAFLLSRFVGFQAQKQFQLADWRIRPLPNEMFDYARSDTHFLLYIFDHMRNELIDKSDLTQQNGNLIEAVQRESQKEALQRYERPVYDVEHGTGLNGWHNLLNRTPILFSREQFAVFRAVHKWRDDIARQEDEGVSIVMSKNVLCNVARAMPLDMDTLLSHSHPVSTSIRKHSVDLLRVIQEAKVRGSNGPDMMEVLKAAPLRAMNSGNSASLYDHKTHTEIEAVLVQDSLTKDLIAPAFRTELSQFWGHTLRSDHSNETADQPLAPRLPKIQLALPLPQLTAEVFSSTIGDNRGNHKEPSIDPGARVEMPYVKDRKPSTNHVFVIKELGGSRKRKALNSDDDNIAINEAALGQANAAEAEGNGSIDSAPDGDNKEAALRIAARKARKAQKKLAKAQQMSLGAKGGKVEEEAFDYTQAPSVLHPRRNHKGSVSTQQPFDPYTKSMNAPKAMKRSQKETQGKSFTFKK